MNLFFKTAVNLVFFYVSFQKPNVKFNPALLLYNIILNYLISICT